MSEGVPDEPQTVHYLCLGCGMLKAEGEFERGSHVCDDCARHDRDQWRENPDGDGYIRREAKLDQMEGSR